MLLDIQTPLGWESASKRAAMFTPSPSKLPSLDTTSPILMPILNSSAAGILSDLLRSIILFWNSTANSTALTALVNSAKTESPAVLKIDPLRFSKRSLRRISHSAYASNVAFSSCSMCLL